MQGGSLTLGFSGFDQRFLTFFDDLALNNDRAWFAEHKREYEEVVVQPLLAFIQAMIEPMSRISEHIQVIPKKQGGSMFRIYRDTRFSKDKTPYKTHAAAQFRHEQGRDVHAPGFYFHASPKEVFLGAGIWHPDSGTLKQIRQAIATDPQSWVEVRHDPNLLNNFDLAGDSLSRPPRGFAADHPCVEDLKRKDFIVVREMAPPELEKPDLVDQVSAAFAKSQAWMAFLCRALNLPF